MTKSHLNALQKLMSVATIILVAQGCAPRESVPVALDEAKASVEATLRVFKPTGSGPFPTVIYLHGAGDTSWNSTHEPKIKKFTDHGFATVFVDFYKWRGASGATVNSGGLLPRATAGDVYVALDWVRRQPWAETGNYGLFGSSFGGATIMDTLVLDAEDKMPTSISSKPAGGLDGVKAAAMLAPWCAKDVMGFNLIKAVHEDFATHVPMLAIVPEKDTISDVSICLNILHRNKAKGMEIETILVNGAGHTFASPNDEYGQPFSDYDPVEAKKAWGSVLAHFKKHL
jgi:dienelactone hydrolase